jgi:hypothetical protein
MPPPPPTPPTQAHGNSYIMSFVYTFEGKASEETFFAYCFPYTVRGSFRRSTSFPCVCVCEWEGA